MCKNCGYDPYLASKVVLFELPSLTVPTQTDDGKHVEVQMRDRPRAYTGRCVGHHRGWVNIRTKANTYNVREDRVIAIIEET